MKILWSMVALLVLSFGVGAYFYSGNPGAGAKSVITYEIKEGSTVTGTKIRTQNKNWNFSEQVTYLSPEPEPNKIQEYVCVVDSGFYRVDHVAGSLSYISKCEENFMSQAAAEASSQYSSTTTFLGYTVVKLTKGDYSVYFAPALQAVLKYELGDGNVIEATNVNVTSVPSVSLPNYTVVSYDDYKWSLQDQLDAEVITQTEYDALYAEIPAQFQ